MSEKIHLYPDIKKIECAFEGARAGFIKCKLYSKETTLESPLFWEINPNCVNIHQFGISDVQFSGDMGGNHAVLKVEFHPIDIVNCELREVDTGIYKGEFLQCNRKDATILREPEFGANWDEW